MNDGPSDKIPLVLYHGSCNDGFASAWTVARRSPGAELRACYHGDPAPDLASLAGRVVWIVDFSFSRDTVLAMVEVAASLRLLDHHRSAADDLADLPCCTFDMTRSGAALTWDTLFPGQARPWFIDYVQDRDLWRWELPDSRAVNAALADWPHTLSAWDELLLRRPSDLAERGAVLVEHDQRLVTKLLRHTRRIIIDGVEVPAINSPLFASELGHALAQDAPFAAIYNDLADGSRVYSLRSDEGGADVSEVARRFGGGGHPRAAGFRVPLGCDVSRAPEDPRSTRRARPATGGRS